MPAVFRAIATLQGLPCPWVQLAVRLDVAKLSGLLRTGRRRSKQWKTEAWSFPPHPEEPGAESYSTLSACALSTASSWRPQQLGHLLAQSWPGRLHSQKSWANSHPATVSRSFIRVSCMVWSLEKGARAHMESPHNSHVDVQRPLVPREVGRISSDCCCPSEEAH